MVFHYLVQTSSFSKLLWLSILSVSQIAEDIHGYSSILVNRSNTKTRKNLSLSFFQRVLIHGVKDLGVSRILEQVIANCYLI